MNSKAKNTPAPRAELFESRQIIIMILGSLLYAATLWFTSFAQFDFGIGVEIRPGIAVPIVLGFIYGPITGFVTGAIGNTLGDQILWGSTYPLWSIGNGIMGLIPGLYALRYRRYLSLRDQAGALVIGIIGIIAGMGFAAWATYLGNPCAAGATEGCFTVNDAVSTWQSASQGNIINLLIMVPIVLFNVERLNLRAVNWRESGLLRRLLLTVLVSAALPVALLGFFLITQMVSSDNADPVPRLIGTIVVSLLFTVANVSLVAQTISRPLLGLTQAARQMEKGELTPEQAENLTKIMGDDEVSRLSQIFGKMAQEVIQREADLKREVAELRIELDVSKRNAQVMEIVDSDFFRELQDKAQAARERKQRQQDQLQGSDSE